MTIKISSYCEEKDFNQNTIQTVQYSVQNLSTINYLTITVISLLHFIPFLGGEYNCLHAKSWYK